MVEDFELEELRRALGIRVEALPSRYTSVGNLVVANDKGALASPILDREALRLLEEVLQVPVHTTRVAGYIQVGAVVVATNTGCVAHPEASDEELKALSEWLGVPATPATVNDGVPFLASGIVANNRGIVVGSATSGPELMILSRAFQA
jgi:translation initiation factor 6